MDLVSSRNRHRLRTHLMPAIVCGPRNRDETDHKDLMRRLESALRDHSSQIKETVSPVVLRYYLYINETFAKDQIALLQTKGFCKILETPGSFQREILQEYYRSCQKAALDFVLELRMTQYRVTSLSRIEWKVKFLQNRAKLSRNLFIAHPWARRMVEIWHRSVKAIQWTFIEGSVTLPHFEDQLRDILRMSAQGLQEFSRTFVRYLTKYARKRKAENSMTKLGTVLAKSLDTLLGILLRNWTLQNLENYCNCFLKPGQLNSKILLYVRVLDKNMDFDPSASNLRDSIVSFCDVVVSQSRESLPNTLTSVELSKGAEIELKEDNFVPANFFEETLSRTKDALEQLLEQDSRLLGRILEKFSFYESIIHGTLESEMEALMANQGTTFEIFAEKIGYLTSLRAKIQLDLSATVESERYEVRLDQLQDSLLATTANVKDRMLATVRQRFWTLAEKICANYAEYADIALTVPKTTCKWIYQRNAVEDMLSSVLPQTEERIRHLTLQYSFMCDHMQVGEDTVALYKEVLMWQRRMNASLVEHRRILRRKRTELESSLKSKRDSLNDSLHSYNGLSEKLQTMGDLECLGDYLVQARSLSHRLQEAHHLAEEINQEEKHFGWMLTLYPLLDQIKQRLDPYLKLFEITSLFLEHQQQWLDSKLGSFNPDAIVRETDQFKMSFSRLEEELPAVPSVRQLVSQVEIRLREFNKVLPLIRTLGNPALRERHWEQIWDTVGIRLSSEAAASLQQLLALQLGDHLGKLEVISSAATQELALENSLIQMKDQWNSVLVPLEMYREGEARVLGNVDDIQRLLEDHIIETQAMRRSAFVKPFEKDAREWEQQLIDLQLLMESCVSIQHRWCRLEPILTSPDVLTVAPEEARKFSAFDKSWRDVLQIIGSHSQIFSLLYVDKLGDKLAVSADQAGQLEDCLQNVLEAKRLQYPRFFLLAESELCELLSHSRNPAKIGSLLWRLYEGVDQLELSADNEVIAVRSSHGETLPLRVPVSFSKCKGQLDKFLGKLESSMKETLTKEIRHNCEELEKNDSLDFLCKAPAQVAILVAHIYCTKILQRSMQIIDSRSASDVLSTSLRSLAEKLEKTGTKIHLMTSTAVHLMALYYKDVCTALEREETRSLVWNCVLKYGFSGGNVEIRVLDAVIKYNMEYLGRPPSHLSVRDLIQLGWNISSSIGGRTAGLFAPYSSTDIIRTVAENCGQRLFVLELSPETSVSHLLRCLKGSIFCDLWLCCSRLERANPFTKQFLSASLSQLRIPEIVPVWLELVDNLAATSYAISGTVLEHNPAPGRRTVADSVNWSRCSSVSLPDIQRVAQLELLGVPQGSQTKVLEFLERSGTFPNASPGLLEKISHLNVICKLKEKSNLGQALYTWGNGRIPKQWNQRFLQNILESFPEAQVTYKIPGRVAELSRNVCEQLNVHCTDLNVALVHKLLECLEHPLPVVLAGPSKSGKTTLIQIASQVFSALKKSKVHTFFVSSEAYDTKSLLGNAGTSILPRIITAPSEGIKLVAIEGRYQKGVHDTILHSFQDGGVLRLDSGEMIRIDENVRIVLEMDNLQNDATPWAAQCQAVYTTQELVGLEHLVKGWIARIRKDKDIQNLQYFTSWVEPLLLSVVPELLQYNAALTYQLSGYNSISAVQQLLKFLLFFIDPLLDKISTKHQSVPETEWKPFMQSCLIFAIVWTLGVPGFVNEKNLSSSFLRNLLERPSLSSLVPKENLIYDYKLQVKDDSKFHWSLWSEEFRPNLMPPRDLPVDELFISTVDSIRIQYLLQMFIVAGLDVVLQAPGAAGKTLLANHFLKHKLNRNSYETVVMNFSKAMHSEQLQDIIMGKMERRRKSVYGPPSAKKAIIFLDDYFIPVEDEDANPKPSLHGNVPALLKSLLEHGIFYDKNTGLEVKVVDVQLVSTCRVSSRCSDFLAPVIMEQASSEAMSAVFSKMLLWHLDARGFGKEFDSCIEEIVQATHAVYDEICATGEFSVYSWNTRDLGRCIHGMLLSVPETIEDVAAMKRLWVHEAIRVFSDRLPDASYSSRIQDIVSSSCKKHLKATVSDLISQLDMADLGEAQNLTADWIFFCDFADPKADARSYAEVVDFEHLQTVVDGYVREFNNMNKRPMPYFVAVKNIIRTLGKISRILKQPNGHVIVCGSSGVGRHSMGRMAAHVSDCELHQFDFCGNSPLRWTFAQWLQSFKTALLRAAGEEKKSVFLVNQSEIEERRVLALVAHVLGRGDVMHLFDSRERNDIVELMRAIDLQKEKSMQTDGSAAALLAMFESRMWEHIRVIVAMETGQLPVLQQRCRQFKTHCQIIWIHEWPEDTLADMFNRLYKETDLSAAEKEDAWRLVRDILGKISEDEDVVCKDAYSYGTFLDWLHTSIDMTKRTRTTMRMEQDLFLEAIAKIDDAVKRIADMEDCCSKWKEQLFALGRDDDQKGQLEKDIDLITCQMDRARDLLHNLAPYESEWRQKIQDLSSGLQTCHLQSVRSASVLAYCGHLSESKRREKYANWTTDCENLFDGQSSDPEDYTSLLAEEKMEISSLWSVFNLPRDPYCLSSALFLTHTHRYPLLIDTHGVGLQWINALSSSKETKPVYLNMADPRYLEQLAGCMQLGATVVLEVTDCPADPALTSLLLKQTFSQGNLLFVKLGTNVIEFSSEFQLFLITKDPNCRKVIQAFQHVKVVNFSMESAGLLETFASALVNNERPDSEERIQLAKQLSEIHQQRCELETNLLNALVAAEAQWIENESIINALLPNIIQSRLLKEKLIVLEQTQHRLETQRESFLPVAKFASRIFQILSSSSCFSLNLEHFLQILLGSLEDDDEEVEADPDDAAAKTVSLPRQISARIFRKLRVGLNFYQKRLLGLVLCFCVAVEESVLSESFVHSFAQASDAQRLELVQEESSNPGGFQEFFKDLQLNPGVLCSSVENLAKKILKLNFFVELQDYVNIVMNLHQSIPILLFAYDQVDVETTIQRIARELDFPDDRLRYSAACGQSSLNLSELEDCVRRGNWLILQDFSHLHNLIENVHVLLEMITGEAVSPDFRVWIVWRMESSPWDLEAFGSVPLQLLDRCRQFVLSQPCTAVGLAKEMFQADKFQKLLSNPLARKDALQDLFVVLVSFQVIAWDRWNLILPVPHLIRLLELIQLFQEQERVLEMLFQNLEEMLPGEVVESSQSILGNLVRKTNASWNRVLELLQERFSSESEADFDCVLLLVDPECRTARDEFNSQHVRKYLKFVF